MRGTSIIGLLLAIAVTAVIFGVVWLVVQGIRTGQWVDVVRWVVLVVAVGWLTFRVVARIRRRRAGDA
jgi:hypothetical protein